MTPQEFFETAKFIALALSVVAFLIAAIRLIRGPTLPDRVLSLDMLVTVGIGFIAVMTVATGYDQYLDVAIALGLVGFLATVAFARYILIRGQMKQQSSVRSAEVSGADTPVEQSGQGETP